MTHVSDKGRGQRKEAAAKETAVKTDTSPHPLVLIASQRNTRSLLQLISVE